MQPPSPESFEREMACTVAEWLRWLPGAIGANASDSDSQTATVRIGEGLLHLRWQPGEPHVVALMRLPRMHVSFRFEGVPPRDRATFMQRFDLYMQRGGG